MRHEAKKLFLFVGACRPVLCKTVLNQTGLIRKEEKKKKSYKNTNSSLNILSTRIF